MDDLIQSLTRWIHIVAGVIWIGHLYFFNFVNAQFAPTMDAETKKKVVPELMPRALYFFRMGALFTWVTGVILLMVVFYHGHIMFDAGGWGAMAILALALVFGAPFIYDPLYKNVLTDPKAGFVGGLVISSLLVFFMAWVAGFSFRAYFIHLGAMFGTIMAFNVWFRIWPAQQQIIRATKEGTAPDAKLVALAGLRSKHNTYMSVPLLFTMMNAHAAWAANPITLSVMILVGWGLVYWLYEHSKTVKGF
ncbi:MAG: urate hydroxylase PuuD [Candidatus Binatia bacterium]